MNTKDIAPVSVNADTVELAKQSGTAALVDADNGLAEASTQLPPIDSSVEVEEDPTVFVNFGHPLNANAKSDLIEAVGSEMEIITVKAQFDMTAPLGGQIEALIGGVGLSPDEWQTRKIVVGLPGMALAAALVAAQLSGRMGYLPTVVALKMQTGMTPPHVCF